MLGFHTDGVYMIGASDTLAAKLKSRKILTANTITGNTLVFAVNHTDMIRKRFYALSFSTAEMPWFICTVGDFPAPSDNCLRFAYEDDLADFITAIYYASHGFLHLDFELAALKNKLTAQKERHIHAFAEESFHQIPKDAFVACFCFADGGFMESDRLFSKLTKECGMNMGEVMLMGSFDSKYTFIRAFVV